MMKLKFRLKFKNENNTFTQTFMIYERIHYKKITIYID